MFHSVKVAAVSMKPTKWDKAGNAARLERLFVAAAQDHPQLIVAPEGALDGYPIMDVIQHPEQAARFLDIAEPLDGGYVARFRRLARDLRTCLCFGFAERLGQEIYNCGVFIDQEGDLRGHYRKVQFAEGTHPSWTFNRIGKTLRAFDTPLGRAGILICNDRWNPAISHTLVLDGARLLIILSYGEKSKAQNRAVLARGRENGVPVVEANVGLNLIISRGEIAAYEWGNDRITSATIDVPEPPSTEAARRSEQEFLRWQAEEMPKRYEVTMHNLAQGISHWVVR